MAVATKQHTFISKYPHLRLVIEPSRPIRNSQGERIGVRPGQAVQFDGNVFVVDDDTEARIDVGVDERGETKYEPRKLVDWLREHRLFNVDFYDRGAPPNAPKPTVMQQVGALMRATTIAEVESVLTVERETHNRDEVFEAADAAAERITGEGDEEKAPSPSISSEHPSIH